MNTFLESLTRRRMLRGMMAGSAVSVGLPLLDIFLNGNGNAMADGSAMPIRFGTLACVNSWPSAHGSKDSMFHACSVMVRQRFAPASRRCRSRASSRTS